jgi:hypothetical protein
VNQSQIYSLARSAGLPDNSAKIAAAIAMAESGGNPNSHNNNASTGDDSYGLWQINMLGSLGPTRRTLYGLKANTDLFNPATNAKVMSAMSSQGKNFSPWTTYTRGTYKQFLSNAVSVVDVNPGDVLGGALGGALGGFLPDAATNTLGTSLLSFDALTKATGALVNTAKWVSDSKNWIRVLFVVGGGILVYAGIETLILPYATKPVAKIMGVVGPGGKVSKVASAAKNMGGQT